MLKNYLKFCNYMSKACGTFAVAALLLSILVIVELVFERYLPQLITHYSISFVTGSLHLGMVSHLFNSLIISLIYID